MYFDKRELNEEELGEKSFSSGEGTTDEPFIIMIPKNYEVRDMKLLLSSIAKVLLESVREDGSMSIKIVKE